MPHFKTRFLPATCSATRDQTVQTPEDLRGLLQQIRRDGYACGRGYIHPEARGIAVPIRGVNEVVVAAVSVVVPNDDAPVTGFVRLLQAAAQAISKDLHAAYAPPNDPAAPPGGRYRTLVSSSLDSMEYLPSAPAPTGPALSGALSRSPYLRIR